MELLYASYEAFAGSRALERRPLSRQLLGNLMKELGYAPVRPNSAVTGEGWVSLSASSTRRRAGLIRKPRPHSYALGDLAAARAQFCQATGLPNDWTDDEGKEVAGEEAPDGTDATPPGDDLADV
jgi:hypothetical protein